MSLKGVYPWHPNLHCIVDNYYELLEEMTLAPKQNLPRHYLCQQYQGTYFTKSHAHIQITLNSLLTSSLNPLEKPTVFSFRQEIDVPRWRYMLEIVCSSAIEISRRKLHNEFYTNKELQSLFDLNLTTLGYREARRMNLAVRQSVIGAGIFRKKNISCLGMVSWVSKNSCSNIDF